MPLGNQFALLPPELPVSSIWPAPHSSCLSSHPSICLLPFSQLLGHQPPFSCPSDAIPHQLGLAWVCRSQQPGSQILPPSDLAESKGQGSPATSGALDTYRKCALLGSYPASGASVSLLCTRRVANVYDRFKVRHKLGVSFLSYRSPESQPTVRVCPYCAHMQARAVQDVVVLLLCFPCGQMEQGRQTGSLEAPRVLSE